MLVMPNRSVRVIIPAIDMANHIKVFSLENAGLNRQITSHQYIQSFIVPVLPFFEYLLTIEYSIYMLYHMNRKRLKQIERKIQEIKLELLEIPQMRPGALTRQYKNPKLKKGGYYQLSYTHKMRSRTEYIRPEFVDEIKEQISVYKQFRKLIEEWIELAIEYSRIKMKEQVKRREK
jgi:hypothetical protein